MARVDGGSVSCTVGGESGIDTVKPMVAEVVDHYDEAVLTANLEDFEALTVDRETTEPWMDSEM